MPWIKVEDKKNNETKRKAAKPYKSKFNSEIVSGRPTIQSVLEKYRPLYEDDNCLISNALKGLKTSSVFDFQYVSNKDRKEIADLIHVTHKSLQFFTNRKKLPPLQSELLLKFFALYDKGLGIFDGSESFNSWLAAPAFGLYNDVPYKLLSTFTGINMVMDELIRIEYGDLA